MGRKTAEPSPDVLNAVSALGRAIEVARKRRRLTQAQLAARAGLGRVSVARAEAGHPGLSLSAFLELLAVLDRDMVERIVEVAQDDPIGQSLAERQLPRRVVNRDDF